MQRQSSCDQIVMTTEDIKRLSRNLEPEEIAVYFAATCLKKRGEKITTDRVIGIVGPRARLIIRKMKQKGILPKGRFDLDTLDKRANSSLGLKDVMSVTNQQKPFVNKQSIRKLVDEMAKHMVSHGATIDSKWKHVQIAQAKRLISETPASVDEWIQVIHWVGNHSFWATKFINLAQLPNYRSRYQMEKHRHCIPTDVRKSEYKEELWAE